MRLRARSSKLLVVLASAGLVAALVGGTSAQADAPTYVALGDSYTSGPLIPLYEEPWGCLKSSNNYAKHVAAATGYTLTDASCSGAKTKDMTTAQGVTPSPNPPQFDRLNDDVDLVTLQIGGNDIGFGGIAETCARAAFEQVDCKDKFVQGDNDELRNRIAATGPKVAAVIQGIHERSPSAKVLVLGYPGIFKFGETAGCPAMGVGESDAQYLRGIQIALNAMIAEQAAANAATYVDIFGPSEGKTACDLPVLRWVEPLAPANAAAPIHPNLTGMLGMAEVVAAAV